MTPPVVPEVECEQHHASLVVSDLTASIEFYTKKLGFRLGFTWGEPAELAGLNLGQVQLFLRQGEPTPTTCSVYFVVGNADELFQFQQAMGVDVVEAPGDRPYGLRDYRVRDLSGYTLGFGHHLFNDGPPIEIERVDVPVRLETRLAAVLRDLAEYKRMNLSSCLEETLLHTFEGVGPHTKGDLRQIKKLKDKYGIDYDSHGSYRFAERR